MPSKTTITVSFLAALVIVGVGGASLIYWFSDKPNPVPPAAHLPIPPVTEGDLTLGVGASGTIAGLTVTFNALVQDNRCPVDVQCIEAGAVNTNVTFVANGATKTLNMPSDEVPQQFEGYSIAIVKIAPDRLSKQEIAPGDYRITFHIKPSDR